MSFPQSIKRDRGGDRREKVSEKERERERERRREIEGEIGERE
jgi:hypothetical protein